MLRRASTVLVVVASTFWVFPLPAPAAVEPTGWAPVFSSSFDGDALPAECTAYDGAAEGVQASWFRPEAVTVSEGHLSLALHRRAYGGKAFVTGELRCLGAAQQFGRYEFKARVPAGAGISSLAMLRPAVPQTGQHGSQLEIEARPGDEQAVVRNGSGPRTSVRTLPGPFSEWHLYAIEWAPSGFRVFVDGKERSVDPDVSTEPRWFGFAVTVGEAGPPGAATALPAEFQVDYLRVYAFAPVSSMPAAAAGVPSTVPNAVPATPPAGQRWSLWLAVVATAAALAALVVLVMRKTRPHRPAPSHRA